MSWSGLQPPVSDDCPSQPEASGAAVKGKKAAFSYLLAFPPPLQPLASEALPGRVWRRLPI